MTLPRQLPWQRTGPGTANDGKPKFYLTKFDQSFLIDSVPRFSN